MLDFTGHRVMDKNDGILLGTLDLQEAKRIKSALSEKHVQLKIVAADEDCSSSKCSPKVQVYVRESDIETVKLFFEKERNRNFSGLDVKPELVNQVFDSEKESAVCPACGTSFSTKLSECPDCGLGFGT